MTIVLTCLIVLFSATILLLILGWNKAVRYESPQPVKSIEGKFSIVIPFRNEAHHLPLLLQDLSSMETDISHVPIFLVDDESEDGTSQNIKSHLDSPLSIISIMSSGEGKVAALNTAMQQVNTEFVLTLDADIRLGPFWYDTLLKEVDAVNDLTILPVVGLPSSSVSSYYAAIDFLSLIGVTYAMAALRHPVMANGAQLLYRSKCAEWSTDTVSGDDVFALHNIKTEKGQIGFCLHQELIARTPMPNSWSALISQRLRWASKTMKYRDKATLALGYSVLATNVLLWVLFMGALLDSFDLSLFLGVFLAKAILDLLFLLPVMLRFKAFSLLKVYPIAAVLNVIQFPLIFVLGRVVGFRWKERRYTR